MSAPELFCSFCDKNQKDVKKIIAGSQGFICNECVILCDEIIREDASSDPVPLKADKTTIPTPEFLYNALGEYVIGQHQTRKTLAVAVHNHYKRIAHNTQDSFISKSNILLIGATGSGKTLMAQALARFLDVPFAIADATTLTEAGYVGEDVENILLRLVQDANYDIEKAQRGIIYIDEIDKITRKSPNPSITRDVSGEGVQHSLLSILEGKKAMVPPQGGRKHPQQEFLQVDTQNILFICGGAFEGLETIIKHHQDPINIGFSRSGGALPVEDKPPLSQWLQSKESFMALYSKYLPEFGLIPELVGRLPVIAILDTLTQQDLVRILTEPKNAIITQFQTLFSQEDITLTFTPKALEALAQKAIQTKTGARGLRTMLEYILMNEMYYLPHRKETVKEIIIHDSTIQQDGLNPEYILRT